MCQVIDLMKQLKKPVIIVYQIVPTIQYGCHQKNIAEVVIRISMNPDSDDMIEFPVSTVSIQDLSKLDFYGDLF